MTEKTFEELEKEKIKENKKYFLKTKCEKKN